MWTVAQCLALELHGRYLPFSYAFGRRVLDNSLVVSVYLSTRLRNLLSVFVIITIIYAPRTGVLRAGSAS